MKINNLIIFFTLIVAPNQIALTSSPKMPYQQKQKISEQELLEKEENIFNIIKSSINLIEQLRPWKTEWFKTHSKNNPSDQEVKALVQEFLINEIDLFSQQLLKLNRELANKLIYTSGQPTTSIDFSQN